MTEIEAYLNLHHTEIKRVVYFANCDCFDWQIQEFLLHTDLDEFVLTGRISEADGQKIIGALNEKKNRRFHIPEKFTYLEKSKLKEVEGNFALVYVGDDDSSDLMELSQMKPKWLLAEKGENGVSAHTIWETYRNLSDHIRIITRSHSGGSRVLDWEKDPENEIELSVIFPMYNVEKYLDKCIQSVTTWKADYVEFLFVNDGSPDNSREVVLKYAQNDSRIKLLDKPNGGCASARQWGLDRAKGRYIGFIDPDDFIDESMFRKLLREAMTGSYDIAYCGHKEYYESTKESAEAKDLLGWPYSSGVSDEKLIWQLIAFRRVAIWRGIYKKKMLDDNNIHFYTELRRFDDLPFFVETMAAAKSVIAVNEYLYYYRLDRPGQDITANDERLYVHFPIFAHLNDSVASKKNIFLTDMLQVCKVGTHRYALEKLKPEFMDEYVEKAREDLNTTGAFFRTLSLINQESGKHNALIYWAIMTRSIWLIRRLTQRRAMAENRNGSVE